ncbi:MAG: hypothetical protein WCF96_01140 [Eubacteriales bacterium]
MDYKIDLLGYKLETAKEKLREKNISFEVIEIFPKSKKEVTGDLRVIQQKFGNNKYILTVCKVQEFEDKEYDQIEIN